MNHNPEVTLHEYRKTRGATQTDIAIETGLSVAMISKLENNQVGWSPRVQEIFRTTYPDQTFDFTTSAIRTQASMYKEKLERLRLHHEKIIKLYNEACSEILRYRSILQGIKQMAEETHYVVPLKKKVIK